MADGVLERILFFVIFYDTENGKLKMSNHKSSKSRWALYGQDGQIHLAVQQSDTVWVKCSSAVEY